MRKNFIKSTILISCLIGAGFVSAEPRTFSTGSLIIPMDSINQDTNNDGIFRGYGLVYQLLVQGITVYSIIDPDKSSNNDPDLTVSDVTITAVNGALYVPVTPFPKTYAGGPFMIEAADASAVLNIIASFAPEYDTVVIHRFGGPVTAEVAASYDTPPKQIGILSSLDSDGADMGETIMACYLELAGIPPEYYTYLSASDIANGILQVESYYILWMPHWVFGTSDDPVTSLGCVKGIHTFLDNGGNILSTCKAIDSLEVSSPLMTTKDIGINGPVGNTILHQFFDIPFSQIGDYPFLPDETNDTQDFRNYQAGDKLATNDLVGVPSEWGGGTSLIALDDTDPNPWAYYALRAKDNDPDKGNMHFIAGHQYVSCQPTIVPGAVYRMATTLSSCKKGNGKTAFWDNGNPCMRITLNYEGGDEHITLEVCEGDYTSVSNNEFSIWTEDPNADPNRFGTNYGPGCQGGGSPSGTDHFDGIFIQNLTTDDNIVITSINVEWTCNGFASGSTGCLDDYQFEQFDIKIDNGNCGNASCDQCTNVFGSGNKTCDADGDILFTPTAKRGSDLAFDGGLASGSSDGDATALNIGGIRYVLNTLFNHVVNPVTYKEFARSGPVVDDGVVYYGTFEFPGNAGHFRAYELSGTGGGLSTVWDAQENVPAFTERNIFTFVDGSALSVDTSAAGTVHAIINDPGIDVASVSDAIEIWRGKFRSKRIGGIERSTPAIVKANDRSNPDRTGLAYFGTTYGQLEMIRLSDGREVGAYMPAAILENLIYTDSNDPNRPKVDSSPTVLDAFVAKDPNDPASEREWVTYLLVGHGSGAPGVSCLDITDPSNIDLVWYKFDENVHGYTQRVSVSKYKKTIGDDDLTLGYAALISSNLPSGAGMQIRAYDLQTGAEIWDNPFAVSYSGTNSASQNDIPAPVAVWDYDNDGFDDRIYVGDMVGRLWQIDGQTGELLPLIEGENAGAIFNAVTGTSPSDESRPIAAAPSTGFYRGKPIVAFGTGGADWANATNNIVAAVDLTDGTVLAKIDIGSRKLFAPVAIAADQLFFIAVAGSVNSPDPTQDIPQVGDSDSLFYRVYLDPDQPNPVSTKTVEKTVAAPYVKNGQTYTGGFEANLTRHGTLQNQESINQIMFRYWRDLANQVPDVDEVQTEGEGTTN